MSHQRDKSLLRKLQEHCDLSQVSGPGQKPQLFNSFGVLVAGKGCNHSLPGKTGQAVMVAGGCVDHSLPNHVEETKTPLKKRDLNPLFNTHDFAAVSD